MIAPDFNSFTATQGMILKDPPGGSSAALQSLCVLGAHTYSIGGTYIYIILPLKYMFANQLED